VKNIILCSDGTGNTAVKNRGTNVFKIFESVDRYGHVSNLTYTPQIAFYDDGVGTESMRLLRIIGGAFGVGLTRNVKQLYTELVRTYQPGDRIYLFGFSRGAYTIRTLAGFISSCGILDLSHIDANGNPPEFGPYHRMQAAVNHLYKDYRAKYRTKTKRFLRWAAAKITGAEKTDAKKKSRLPVHRDVEPGRPAKIAFIGVWDTVDAVGFPIPGVARLVNAVFYRFKFTDLKLGKCVDKACHAISIDDARQTFHPVLWEDAGDDRIEQVWFAGVHSNVGGGYPKQGLSMISLDWMVNHAEAAGMRLSAVDRSYIREGRNAHCKLYDSRAGASLFYRYKPRKIPASKVHISVLDRLVLGTEGYAPGNIHSGSRFVDWDPLAKYTVALTVYDAGPELENFLGNKGQLLRQVKGFVACRRLSHRIMLLGVAAGATNTILLIRAGTSIPSGELAWAGFLKQHYPSFIVPAILLASAFMLGTWAKNKMHGMFCDYWFRCRGVLKNYRRPFG
jgi:uncharacterized protein (DUF2235 family)